MDVVKPAMLSFDRYHLMRKETSEKNGPITDPETAKAHAAAQTKYDNPGWYNNLEEVRQLALRYDVPYMIIILLTEHGQYRYLTREEISYEVWQTLAYGCTALSYFTYWTPGGGVFTNCMISEAGEKTVHYYDVQAINAAVRPIGERIAQTRSEAVFHVGDEDKREHVTRFTAEGYGAIRSIGGGDYTVGFFEDGTFIIANKDYEAPHRCTVTADAALEIFDIGTGTFVPVTENTFNLPAGGGVYLRVADR